MAMFSSASHRPAICRATLLVLLLLVAGASCTAVEAERNPGLIAPTSTAPGPTASPESEAPSSPDDGASPDDAVDRVLAISVDGLSATAIAELGPKRTPALHRMLREGAGTLNARTAREQTRTLPNHTGMLTSRRIDTDHGGHGVTDNTDRGSTVHQTAGRYVPSVFDVVHDHGGQTALFAAKTKFAMFARTWNTNGRADKVGPDNGKAKIDRVRIDGNNARLVDTLIDELEDKPRTFTFLHLSLPDDAGHQHGFTSPEYQQAVERADDQVGRLLDTVAAQPALRDHLLVVLTADHGGGRGTSHSTATASANYRIPFLVWGPGVARGADLYDLNPQLRRPGSDRTTYAGRQPVRNGDLANFVTDVLDQPAVGGSELNRSRTLNVFPR